MTNHETGTQRIKEYGIMLFPFSKAPWWLQDYSEHGGDEDWIAQVPAQCEAYADYLFVAGTPFGISDVSKIRTDDGFVIYIGAHA